MASLRSAVQILLLIFPLFASDLLLQPKCFVAGANDSKTGNSESDFCNDDLSSFLPPPYGNLSSVRCQLVWNTFVLRHSQSKDHVITFVLSALYTTGWVGIGFSKNGKMLGASAMVGWISKTGHARIKQYHAKGYTPSEVIPGKGNLNLTDIPPVVVLNGANIYLAFQLKFTAPLEQQPTLLAFGSRYPINHVLSIHDDKTTLVIDYSAAAIPSNSGGHGKMKKSHGILGIFGWGFILPVGAMVARFLKHKEPLWYYLHTVIQFTGFLIALAGVVVGQALYNQMHADVAAHKGIGYFALTLSIIQILAFFIRPNKDSKFRRLWDVYHRTFGVITLFFGAVNIVFGIHLGGAGSEWKIGYGFLLGTIIVAATVLQVLSMLRTSQKSAQSPAFQMN
ncbi:hypothetical protein Ancab_037998 [Ancistrocladus abbreviatus]